MTEMTKQAKLKRATAVICRQGLVQFSVSDTALAIVDAIVGDNEHELDLIYAFREKASQTLDQLVESSGFPKEKVEALANRLAKKGLVFNQPSSTGVMVYRLLPLMLVGVMEYKFMVDLTGSHEEKNLARLFEKLLEELRDQVQDNYDSLSPIFTDSPAIDHDCMASFHLMGKHIVIGRLGLHHLQSRLPGSFPEIGQPGIFHENTSTAEGNCFL